MYIDRKLVASTMYSFLSPDPERPAISPLEMMLGCHKDATNTSYRNFISASLDELAVWNESLLGPDVDYFTGSYSKCDGKW